MDPLLVERIPFFSNLTRIQQDAIAAKCVLKIFDDRDVILKKDGSAEGLFIIIDGKVKISYSDATDETIFAVLGAGDFFGELSTIDGIPTSAEVVAIAETHIFHLSVVDFDALLLEMPEIAVSLLKFMARRLRRATEWIRMLSSQDVFGRLAAQLVMLVNDHGEVTPDGVIIKLRLTQNNLASLVGASRESVNKAVGFFKSKNYISIDSFYRITVFDLDALKKRCI